MGLTLEQQKELAKFEGYSDFDAWLEMDKKRAEKTERELAEAEAYKPTKAEIARKINDLRTNPFAIEYYRRITLDYDLTVEEQIAHLESLETSD
ncbi:hypothetical protein ACU6T4_09090 [Avibacterium paragallinarum]|uniref:hypothetical protein n=1 Tax=Avibacterium paragallinarum TaxID=728 RepID=UPI0014521BFF|nr:hypothetical protein [Avibacterium paragallinarum]QJE10273.1 hypothetical protein HHJ62_08240 [Avibacterium paragallinarum]QJE12467.1 hypothetical protein HHJ61_08250 [Avibacterium paragallinarum]QJE14670.1 hypothetical protein HHJ60_08265 [Avibacterium paragallinarum]QJE16867.1 hypothetical protein HHJ59_08250 [Avibacterium paragallinarum]QJE19063.1 hypothetical protein HHJ57_08240 [Avibacterium paragallinarum]